MNRQLYFFIIITGIIISCEKEPGDSSTGPKITESSTLKADDNLLADLYQEILGLSTQFECADSGGWNFTPIGSKACGGPTGFIAYSFKIDEAEFLKKVTHYTSQQAIYNEKWGMISDCSVPPQPKGIECEDGLPKFVY